MAATFPGGVKVFTTKQAGDQIASAHINDLQDEVVAVETELRKTTGSVVSHGSLAGLSNNDHPQYLLSASTNYPRADGWIPVSDTWTYASATTVTVPTGAASIYTVGMGIRLTANSVVKQAYITKVENTKLTVAGDALTNHTFSAISYTPTPQTALGFPVWFNYTPTLAVDGGTAPTFTSVFDNRFSMIGKLVNIQSNWRNASGGTAGSGTSDLTASLPVNPAKNNYVAAGTGTVYSSTLGTSVIVQINPQNAVHFSKAATIAHLSGNDFSSALRELTFTIAYEAA